MNFFLSIIAGTITGILSGFGIGGGTLLIIVMTGFGGIPQIQAQGINLMYFIPCAIAALWGHIRRRLVDFKAFFWTAIPGLLSTIASSLLLSGLDQSVSKKIFGVFLLIIGAMELFGKRKT